MENATDINLHNTFSDKMIQTVVVYTWEKIILSIYGAFVLLGGTAANGLVLFLTAKHTKFHEAYMYIRAAYAVVDIIFAWGIAPIVLANLFVEDVPTWVTCYVGDIGFGMFNCTVHFTALIALERYCYFCHPLKYHRFFNLKTISCICTTIIILTQAYVFGTEIIYGREFQFVTLLCQLKEGYHHAIQAAIWYIPSFAIVVYSIVSIQMMITNMATNDILPASMDTLEPRLRRQAGRKAIKLILLVSGAFWLSCLPAIVLRTIILSMGFTWEQLNTFEYPAASSALRIGQFSSATSVILDPIIYFAVNPDLRRAFKTSVGINTASVTEQTNY